MEDATYTTIEEAVAQLKRDPARVVKLRLDDVTVEMRALPEHAPAGTAAELFARVGPWAGETTEELQQLLAEGGDAARSRRAVTW